MQANRHTALAGHKWAFAAYTLIKYMVGSHDLVGGGLTGAQDVYIGVLDTGSDVSPLGPLGAYAWKCRTALLSCTYELVHSMHLTQHPVCPS